MVHAAAGTTRASGILGLDRGKVSFVSQLKMLGMWLGIASALEEGASSSSGTTMATWCLLHASLGSLCPIAISTPSKAILLN